jgi:integrase
MTREEVKAVLSHLRGDKWRMVSLMYGAGLRLMECLRLRVQDIDFARNEVVVRDGKGAKDRVTMLPESVKVPLQEHLRVVKPPMSEIWPTAGDASRCPTPWIASTPTPPPSGAGSGSSHKRAVGETRVPVRRAVTISTSPSSKEL